MPKNNSISKRQTTQNEIENSQNDLQSLQEALQPLGWNQARIKFLAAFLVAILTVQSVNLVKIANVFPTKAAKDSAYKRLQRFLAGFSPNLDVLACFLAQLCKIPAPWNLSMDRTNWKLGKRHLNVLMLSIVAPGISFPLMWIVLEKQGKGKAGNSSTSERILLLERFIKIFGSESCRYLFADRESHTGTFPGACSVTAWDTWASLRMPTSSVASALRPKPSDKYPGACSGRMVILQEEIF